MPVRTEGDPDEQRRQSDDVSITMFGDHRFAKTFKGKDEVYTSLFGPIRETLNSTIRMKVTNAIADSDMVVVEAR